MKTRTYFTHRIDLLDGGGGRDRRERIGLVRKNVAFLPPDRANNTAFKSM
jgi:hypothetical protein